ncbi:MAG: protein-glutamine gamma-glutamyltransferase [Gaiellaceae bacterium]|nr:protein-glutamine gamma-glutamyltransferase [Gaiellaceae bacterium]
MRRTALLYGMPALVIALDWTRLERPRGSALQLALILVLALLPALARPLWRRIALGVGGLAAAASSALAVSWLDARPFDGRHDFFGPLLSRFGNGFLDFYDYEVPIDPAAHPGMHGVILLAVFGFCLALAVAIAARRAMAAGLVLVVGAGWPSTLLSGGHEVARGTWILLALLLLLAGLGAGSLTGMRRALVPAAVVAVAAVAASASPALAKPEFLRWQNWDFYTRPDTAVGVRYVWDSTYTGIHFPKKQTVVLKVKAPPTSLYWRATTLEGFNGIGWVEVVQPQNRPETATLEPAAASNRRHWIRQDVTVKALRDTHLVAASIPVAYHTHGVATEHGRDNIALVPAGLTRDQRYSAWSYAPDPTPAELARSRPRYPDAIAREGFLAVPGIEAVPAFGEPNRRGRLRFLFDRASTQYIFDSYRPLEAKAQQIAGDAKSPYAAAASLETWFRATGGFQYDQSPPKAVGAPPLVDFVMRTKAGYCQHYAGAMALMLRYLGVPARVAAGFTSGTYDAGRSVWTVTDHDAHTWVEVWFDGYGWLPFDPTPGRGSLTATYSVSSPRFDLSSIAKYLGAGVTGGQDVADLKQNGNFGQRGVDRRILSRTPDAPGSPSAGLARGRAGGSLLKLLALAALVLGGAIVLMKALRRGRRYLIRDPRRIAGACRNELADYLVDQRVRLPAGATLEDVGAATRAELAVDASAFVRAAAAARYGPPAQAGRAARSARRELRRLRRALRRRLATRDRLRGLLSLRSLGFLSG